MHGGVGHGEQPGELDRVGAGRPPLRLVGLVPDLEVVDLAVDVAHHPGDEVPPFLQLGLAARCLPAVLRVVERPVRHPDELEPNLEPGRAGRADGSVDVAEPDRLVLDRLHGAERRGGRDHLGAGGLGQPDELADLVVGPDRTRRVAGGGLHVEVDLGTAVGGTSARRSAPALPARAARWPWGCRWYPSRPGWRSRSRRRRWPRPARRRRRPAPPRGRARYGDGGAAASASAGHQRPGAATEGPAPSPPPSRSATRCRDRGHRR